MTEEAQTQDVKLPEPAILCDCGGNYFTADQVRAAVMAERRKADEYRSALEIIAAQGSANPCGTSRVDCMAAIAAAAIRSGSQD